MAGASSNTAWVWCRVWAGWLVGCGVGCFHHGAAQPAGEVAARLAERVAGAGLPAGPVTWANHSEAGAGEWESLRGAVEASLRQRGWPNRAGEAAWRIALSEDRKGRFLLAELPGSGEGEPPRLISLRWERPERSEGARLERRAVVRLNQEILDFRVDNDRQLRVLTRDERIVFRRDGETWRRESAVAAGWGQWLGRDARGKLTAKGWAAPGVACVAEPVSCAASEGLELGGGALLGWRAHRNDAEELRWNGRAVAAGGAWIWQAAPLGRQWLLAGTDGRWRLNAPEGTPIVVREGGGSELAKLETECGVFVVGTAAGDGSRLSAWRWDGARLNETGPKLALDGPARVLWPVEGEPRQAALVWFDARSGQYEAAVIGMRCH